MRNAAQHNFLSKFVPKISCQFPKESHEDSFDFFNFGNYLLHVGVKNALHASKIPIE
jgi:hypothetical protein